MLIKDIKGVKSEKIFPWFRDKDLSSVNLLSETYDFVKSHKFA